jgi:homocitrate synthase NifV
MNAKDTGTRTHGPWLVDSTLREGEQAPGVVFALRDKLELASRLADLGIPELEMGTPAMGSAAESDIAALLGLGLPIRLTAWCRARRDDLEAAARCGVTAVHVSLPASPLLRRTMGKTEEWVIDSMIEALADARRLFDFVSVGLKDASRAPLTFLERCAAVARESGAGRLRLADTVGIWNPLRTHEIFSALRRRAEELPLGFHGHNDLGMAVGNSLSAFNAGAHTLDVTVGGLGERSGNAPLEQVVMALELSEGIATGVDASGLYDLSRIAARASGRIVPPDRPVVGESVFRHESGVHVASMLRDSRAYEPFSPARVGAPDRTFVAGITSGSKGLREVLDIAGEKISRMEAASLLPTLRAESLRLGRSLSADELVDLRRMTHSEREDRVWIDS